MSDLLARFLPRFEALTRERAAKALAIAVAADASRATIVAGDMHSVAGEAGMLGLAGVLKAARQAEAIAKRFAGDAAQSEALVEALRTLESELASATGGTT